MEVIKDRAQTVLRLVMKLEDQHRLFITSIAGFHFGDMGTLMDEIDTVNVTEKVFKNMPIDHGLPKQNGEFLVAGRCFVPDRKKPLTQHEVMVEVGKAKRRLLVFGDRVWKRNAVGKMVISDPETFTSMPLDYEHAWGGPKDLVNPQGKGIADEDVEEERALPNVESVKELIVYQKDTPGMQTLLPLPAAHPHRVQHYGTVDQAYVDDRWPDFPKDFSRQYFNTSHTSQQITGFWGYEDSFRIENMNAFEQVIESTLPGMRMHAFVKGNERPFEEVSMHCDTVWLIPEHRMGLIVHHGEVLCADEDGSDIQHIFTVVEKSTAPEKPLAVYEQMYKDRIGELAPDLEAEAPELPDFAAEESATGIDFAALAAGTIPVGLTAAALAEALGIDEAAADDVIKAYTDPYYSREEQQRLVEQQEKLEASRDMKEFRDDVALFERQSGMKMPDEFMSPEPYEQPASPSDVEFPEGAQETSEAFADAMEGEHIEAAEAMMQQESGGLTGRMSDMGPLTPEEQALMPPQYDATFLPPQSAFNDLVNNLNTIAPPAAVIAASLPAELAADPDVQQTLEGYGRAQALQEQEIREEAANVHAMQQNPELGQTPEDNITTYDEGLALMEEQAQSEEEVEQIREMRAANAVAESAPTAIPVSDDGKVAGDMQAAYLPKQAVAGAAFLGVSFAAGALLNLSSFTETTLEDTTFDNVSAEGCSWQKVDMKKVKISGGNHAYSQFEDVVIEESTLEGVDFTGSTFKRCVIKANATECTFTEAQFEEVLFEGDFSGSMFIEAELKACDLIGMTGEQVAFTQASLEDIKMEGVVLKQADFQEASLTNIMAPGADLTGAMMKEITLDKGDFTEAVLTKVMMDGGDIRNTTFMKADVSEGNLSNLKTEDVSFREANFTMTLCAQADFEGVEMQYLKAKDAVFRKANLTGAKLQEAQLMGASFDHAILIKADLFGSNLYDTSFMQADMTKANLTDSIMNDATRDNIKAIAKKEAQT